MRVLMLGWEFPPYKSGGLGTACYDLTKGLSEEGADVLFVMPIAPDGAEGEFVKLLGANQITKDVEIKGVATLLTPYMSSVEYGDAYQAYISGGGDGKLYGKNMWAEIQRYNAAVAHLARTETFDIIHAHDWMTYTAGIIAKEESGKPLIVHMHNTVFNRYGGKSNGYEYDIERAGFHAADQVIAISHMIKDTIQEKYEVPAEKIDVVHWGITQDSPHYDESYRSPINKTDKIVLSLGRITLQKGIDYLVHAASHVSNHIENVKFVIVGQGDMMPQIIKQVADLGLSDKFIFTGWLKGKDVHRAYQMADVFVMPSVSEPFGLVALESIKNGTPVILSKQSGASEVVHNALKVDFWDTHQLANQLVSVLSHDSLHRVLKTSSYNESHNWELSGPAQKCMGIYNTVMRSNK
jgi:glycogen synthase